MGESFMSAITQIDDLVSKKRQIIERAAALLSEAILDRMRTGNLTRNTEKDIKNAIKNFSTDEQAEILTRAMILVGMNSSKNNSRNDDDDDDYGFNRPSGKKVKERSDIFGRRRYDD